jgi:NAD+ diphosphatase
LRKPNVFSGPYLDRAAHLRKDAAYVAAALRDPNARLIPVWKANTLLRRAGARWSAALLAAAPDVRERWPERQFVMLGHFHGQVCFAVDVPDDAPPDLGDDMDFKDLRFAGGELPAEEAGLLAYARAMVLWRQRHRYCGTCGTENSSASAGHVMKCSNPACGAEHFPRLDPAIIVLVTDGDRALLGRQASWPQGRYSTIAGFVEPGESLEDAVAREVLEETGVTVLESSYHSSQPWPFPSSLMIGYTAVAAPGSVIRTDDELEDARWFTRADIASGTPALPPPQSVSFRLIEDWFDSGSDRSLRESPGLRPWDAQTR